MKQLPVILLVIFLLLGAYIVHEYFATMSPAWQTEAAAKAVMNVQDYQDELRNAAERRAFFTEFYRLLWVVVLCAGVGVVGVYLWRMIDERTESKARMVDGSYALQTFRGSNGQVYVTDPNKQQFGVIGFDKASGQLITDASIVGPDRQLDYAKAVQRTRTTHAASAENGIKYAAHAKFLAGAYDKPQPRIVDDYDFDDEPAQLTAYQPLNLLDAYKQSTADNWLLGNGAQGPCSFNVFDVVHTGLIGATKTGKTSSTALLMALNARNHGMHVIALDGAGGVDWRPYGNILEVHESDYTTIGDQINELVRIHETRMKEIKRAGVPNIDELDYQIPSLFVVMEEHGRTMQAYESANKKGYTLTESALSNFMRVSRKTGIYFLLIDQSLNGWSGEVKANVKDYIAYHLGGGQGAAFNAYKLHELRPNGQFWNNGNVYDAWHTKPQADVMLKKLQPARVKLLTDAQYRVVEDDDDTSIAGRGEYRGQTPTPHHDTSISSDARFTPVSDTSIDTGIVNDTGTARRDTGTANPRLTGKPTSQKERALIVAEYKLQGSINKTCEALYGGLSPSRKAWIKEVLGQGGLLQ